MVGSKAASILDGAGAVRNPIDDLKIKVDMLLPERVFHHVCQWGHRLKEMHDHDNDIRNNLIGGNPAQQIMAINLAVIHYLRHGHDPDIRLELIEDMQDDFPYMQRESLEEEFDLTAAAPISEKLVPPLEAIPLLYPKLYTDAGRKDEL